VLGRRTAGNAAVAVLVVTAGFAVVWVLALPWLAANLVLLGISLVYGWARSQQARARVRAKLVGVAALATAASTWWIHTGTSAVVRARSAKPV
jgi:hypothetical protein